MLHQMSNNLTAVSRPVYRQHLTSAGTKLVPSIPLSQPSTLTTPEPQNIPTAAAAAHLPAQKQT